MSDTHLPSLPATPALPAQGPSPSVPSGDLIGEMTHAGTMHVGGDPGVTGVFVSMTVDELRAVRYLPMYRRVAVLPADILGDWTVRASDFDRCAAALRLCRDTLSIYRLMLPVKECAAALDAADAGLSPVARISEEPTTPMTL